MRSFQVETATLLSTLAAVLVLVTVHLFAGKLRFLDGTPRSRWLSFAGGVSVAYVFVHVLPELSEGQHHFEGITGFLEHHIYLIALAGLVLFYGLERAALTSRQEDEGGEDTTGPEVFWLHVVSFSIYNAVIGYLLIHREDHSVLGLAWYTLAMALHFLVSDFGLREHHKHKYRRQGRWILSAAIAVGWLVGLATEVSEVTLLTLFAFVAGGVVLNVLKEELPEERRSRFASFLLGTAVYVVLLQIQS